MELDGLFSGHFGIVAKYLRGKSGVAVVLLDKDKVITDCNEGFVSMLGVTEKPVGRGINEFVMKEGARDVRIPTPGGFSHFQLDMRANGSAGCFLDGHAYNTADGAIVFLERRVLEGGETSAKIAVLTSEISTLSREYEAKKAELEKAKEAIIRIMDTDPLTGLVNRRYFMESLKKSISFARRSNMPLSIVMCDFDNFKFIIDTYGHEVAEGVMVEFSKIMNAATRAEDTVARVGNDEFLVLLPNTTVENAVLCAERMSATMKGFTVPGVAARLSASFGVTTLIEEDTDEGLLKRVDGALFKAKSGGLHRVAAV